MYRSSWKRATHFVKMYIMIIRSDDSVVEPFYKRYKFILGCHREIILYYWFYFSWAKTLWAAVKCWFQQLDIMTDHFGHLMAHIFNLWDAVRAPVVTHSWLVSVCAVQFSRRMWAWQWGAVCVSLLRAPVLWELHIKTQRALCSRYLKKKSRKTMALRSHEKVSLCQRVEKQPI